MELEKFNGIKVEMGGYILSLNIENFNTINGNRTLVDIHHIKTKRQKYFRKTEEFYNEFNNMKVKNNVYDQWSGILSSSNTTLEEVANNKRMVLEILDIEDCLLLEYTKKSIKEYVVKQVEEELDQLDG